MIAETRNCPVCDSVCEPEGRIGTLQNTCGHRLSRETYDLVRCLRCGLLYISPLATNEDLLSIYVGSTQFDEDTYTDPERVKLILKYHEANLMAMLERAGIEAHSAIRVLEPGAGYAWMSRVAKEMNAKSFTMAQDITSEVADCCPWVDRYVVEGFLETSEIDKMAPFDIVSLNHVIEHVPDPVTFLKKIKDVMSVRGTLFVAAPRRPAGWTHGSGIEKWQKYSYNHCPAHLQYFCESSMRWAAHAAGLQVVMWNEQNENGEAFDSWLTHETSGPT